MGVAAMLFGAAVLPLSMAFAQSARRQLAPSPS